MIRDFDEETVKSGGENFQLQLFNRSFPPLGLPVNYSGLRDRKRSKYDPRTKYSPFSFLMQLAKFEEIILTCIAVFHFFYCLSFKDTMW